MHSCFSSCFLPTQVFVRLVLRSSSIFGMHPTPNAQSTDALRTHARRCKFTSRPPGFGLLPPDKLWSPSKKLATSPWESVCVRHPPGKCEPHTRKISQKELEAMYLNEIKIMGFVGQDAELKNSQNSKELVRFDIATKASWTNRESGEY